MPRNRPTEPSCRECLSFVSHNHPAKQLQHRVQAETLPTIHECAIPKHSPEEQWPHVPITPVVHDASLRRRNGSPVPQLTSHKTEGHECTSTSASIWPAQALKGNRCMRCASLSSIQARRGATAGVRATLEGAYTTGADAITPAGPWLDRISNITPPHIHRDR